MLVQTCPNCNYAMHLIEYEDEKLDQICKAINTLPEDVRRTAARALRERLPIYPWTMSRDGRLECRC